MTPSIRRAVIAKRKERPDLPILTAYWDARRHEHFMETLSARVASGKRRSKAAKAAWKRRKAAS
jgi:hypothetical protein